MKGELKSNKVESLVKVDNSTANNAKLKAQTYKCRFLQSGLVRYQDENTEQIEGYIPENELTLIKDDNLMKIADSFKGSHVILQHKEIRADGEEDNTDEIVGYIGNVWLGNDAWAWCDFTVNDQESINLINEGFSVSCAYYPVYSQGGVYHDIAYDKEIIGGEALHLAIVDNPRYEEAIILKNSIIKKTMKKLFKSKKEKVENNIEVQELDLENSLYEIEEGKTVKVSELLNAYKEAKKHEEEEKAKKEAEEKLKVNGDQEYEVDGEMVKVSELAKSYMQAKKNEEEEEKEAKKNAEEEEAKKNAEEEEKKKNEEEEEDKAKKEAAKNSKDAEKIKKAKSVLENGKEEETNLEVILDSDRFELGKSAYGSSN